MFSFLVICFAFSFLMAGISSLSATILTESSPLVPVLLREFMLNYGGNLSDFRLVCMPIDGWQWYVYDRW